MVIDTKRRKFLLRFREVAVEEARRALELCLATEDRARSRLRAIQGDLECQRLAAQREDADDVTVDAFAIWLHTSQAIIRQAEEMLAHAEAETAQRRADLRIARGLLEATRALCAGADAEAQSASERLQAIEANDLILRSARDE
jgi:hypothetical protein